jgi:hypothetical protein
MVWIFGGMLLSFAGHGVLRILGFLLLLLFVANYIFLAYAYSDDSSNK